ncbi:MAG: division/cell wall cluster transcriptional repressor MraZ [Armatimonadota bacterium]
MSGTYIYGMDRKGRVVMPAQFRTQLGVPFVLTRAPGQCLLALSEPQWEALVERYEQSVLFRGYYLSAAVNCPVDDTTGRFLIPHVLREYAELRPMDEVAICGIGRAVQVARRTRWEEHLKAGEFPSLGQLDLDLEVPRPVETQPYEQKTRRILGLPVIQCRGRMHGKGVRRLLSTIMKLMEDQPPLIVLDVRETGETLPAMGLVQTLSRPQRVEKMIPLWVVADVELPSDDGVFYFRDLEDVFLRLEELRPPTRRRAKRPDPEPEEILGLVGPDGTELK